VSLLLFRNARIFTPRDAGGPARGAQQGKLDSWVDGALLCRDGRIVAAGADTDVRRAAERESSPGSAGSPRPASDTRGSPPAALSEVDCEGRCMIPGFVDPHTHLCFIRPREREFLARLEGADYLSILKGGGGILSSVREVRAASESSLAAATAARVFSAVRLGTTTIEIKSGYGLSLAEELKQLRAIRSAADQAPARVVSTFLGAHAVPAEYAGRADEYTELVIREMIPAVAAGGLARFCDVFSEQGVFDIRQARRILEAARAAGLRGKLHADELHDTGGARLAADLGAASADHLLAASDEGLRAMADAGVPAVLLPATAYSMRRPYARARAMVDMGVAVALATDCNPGSSCTESMPFTFGLAVMQMGLTVAEALTASTLNAAYAVGLGAETGSLTAGKAADFVLLDGETPGIIAFRAGIPPVAAVYASGVRVWPAERNGARGEGRG
jgi:imidazolonepropionase